ncbi:MAG: 4'-phosphopantetheinyl transferase superfamily protein [Myxococcaceae bacterium]|nr:4'-phosphopantetheinyl transferase superfamily protein [Myxococcaceae bacterium]
MTDFFHTAWVRPVRFGVLAAVALPRGLEPVPATVLERLHPRERALAEAERGRRQIEVVGGRLAYRAAAKALGADVDEHPLLSDSARAPLAPADWAVSLTHKEDLAVALVGPAQAGLLGVDLEGGARDRSSIASRVCRPEELALVEALPQAERWPDVMVRFAVKEAVYKALAPRLGRFFGFQAARVDRHADERVSVALFLEPTDPAFELEAEVLRLEGARIVAMVRARG